MALNATLMFCPGDLPTGVSGVLNPQQSRAGGFQASSNCPSAECGGVSRRHLLFWDWPLHSCVMSLSSSHLCLVSSILSDASTAPAFFPRLSAWGPPSPPLLVCASLSTYREPLACSLQTGHVYHPADPVSSSWSIRSITSKATVGKYVVIAILSSSGYFFTVLRSIPLALIPPLVVCWFSLAFGLGFLSLYSLYVFCRFVCRWFGQVGAKWWPNACEVLA